MPRFEQLLDNERSLRVLSEATTELKSFLESSVVGQGVGQLLLLLDLVSQTEKAGLNLAVFIWGLRKEGPNHNPL